MEATLSHKATEERCLPRNLCKDAEEVLICYKFK